MNGFFNIYLFSEFMNINEEIFLKGKNFLEIVCFFELSFV